MFHFLFKVLQYKQRCAELEGLAETDAIAPCSGLKSRSSAIPLPAPSAAMEQAQQHLRDTKSERVQDLETALRRLDEEKRK